MTALRHMRCFAAVAEALSVLGPLSAFTSTSRSCLARHATSIKEDSPHRGQRKQFFIRGGSVGRPSHQSLLCEGDAHVVLHVLDLGDAYLAGHFLRGLLGRTVFATPATASRVVAAHSKGCLPQHDLETLALKRINKFVPTGLLLGLLLSAHSGLGFAQDVSLMKGVVPRASDNPRTEVDKYKKKGPWKIGMSHFGLSNSWAIQMAHESEYEATSNPNVAKFMFRDAGLSVAKQFADIDDLIAKGVDVLIVTPLTPTSATAGINKAIAAGVPVVVHTGITTSDSYTVEIQGGGEYFGRVMGEWLVSQLRRKGAIWVLRGVPKHPEDINRNRGLMDAIKGTEVKVRLGGYGDWSYKGGKTLCEDLYKINPEVDGIWSSGADMARACIDVFKSRGAAIPPITGEGNNGFFKIWRDNQLKAIAPEYGPEQGAAGVRAAIALLEGKSLYKHYVYNPPPITVDIRDKFLRVDLVDEYWFPSALSEERKKALYGVKK